ncbi:MAG TPA: hypothetical protein VMS37_08245 [Verrucomicrobiae bacterium]|nr:hypothetical protein [Verrucomicrobiae bacterium]
MKFSAWNLKSAGLPLSGGGGVMLLVVAAPGCWAPARRASRIDPMAALRND